MTSYKLEAEDRVFWIGQPHALWVETPEGRAPAIVGSKDFRVAVRVDSLNGALVRGRFGFLDRPQGRRVEPVARATFRVRLAHDPKLSGVVLFEASLASAQGLGLRSFVTGIPAADERCFVSLEVEYQSARRSHLAAWIDPVVESQRYVDLDLPDRPWNVLLITSDTTRQDFLSCYGGPARTVALEGLAADGFLFDNAFSVAYGTTPSHASLLTASYAAQHKVYDNKTVLAERHLTLQEVLRSKGYSTAAFVSSRPLVRALGFDQGFDYFDDVLIYDEASGLGIYSQHERRADATISRFSRWLDEQAVEPFFAWIHLFDPHQPYSPPPGHEVKDPDSSAGDAERWFRNEDGMPAYLLAEQVASLPPEQLEEVDRLARERYRGEIEFLDGQLQKILRKLKDEGLYDETVIVFVADHGENFIDRGRAMAFRHTGLLRDVTRLPLIMKLPELGPLGRRQEFLLGTIDIAPTILDLLGIETPEDWAGRSFLPLLGRSGPRTFRQYLVLEGAMEQEISVRSSKWMYRELVGGLRSRPESMRHLGYDREGASQRFDLETDPSERTVLDPSKCPDLENLRAILESFLAAKRDEHSETLATPDHLEALRALGYAD